MRIGLSIGSAYYDGSNWDDMVELVRAADRTGVDFAWTAEAWGMETIAPLAYLAPLTERIKLGTGIMQVSARTPAMTAMTALTMDRLSNGRFCLGLGVSGPQVVEGLHGDSFDRPLQKLREYVAIVRKGISGERVTSEGPAFVLPRPGGQGKALRLGMPPAPGIPVYLATLGPRMLELTGEIADGWLGTSFIPEASGYMIDAMRRGAERSGRTLADLDLQINATIEVGENVEQLLDKYRPAAAFTLGAMGSASTNFYNAAYSRAGWDAMCEKVQGLWVSGDKAAAVAAVEDDFLLSIYMIGTEKMVRARMQAAKDAGINTLRVAPVGRSARDMIDNLERIVPLVASV